MNEYAHTVYQREKTPSWTIFQKKEANVVWIYKQGQKTRDFRKVRKGVAGPEKMGRQRKRRSGKKQLTLVEGIKLTSDKKAQKFFSD